MAPVSAAMDRWGYERLPQELGTQPGAAPPWPAPPALGHLLAPWPAEGPLGERRRLERTAEPGGEAGEPAAERAREGHSADGAGRRSARAFSVSVPARHLGLVMLALATLILGAFRALSRAQEKGSSGGHMDDRLRFLSRSSTEEEDDAEDRHAWPNASFIAALPIADADTKTTTVAPRVPCEYGPAQEGDSTCPEGTAALTEAECRSMPYYFGGVLHNPHAVETNDDPWGCFLFNDKFYYNSGLLGKGRHGRTPFCKRCQVVTAVTFAGESQWKSGDYLVRKASTRFRLAHQSGSCEDLGMHNISDQATCEVAAKELMLGERRAALTCLHERPAGCYYCQNHGDHTSMLFLNVNPTSKGNGAETSAFKQKIVRLPICKVMEEDPARGRTTNREATAAPDICRSRKRGIQKITEGTCEDVGLDSIIDDAACEEAARQLALADTKVERTSSKERPRGCYYYRNPEDLTATLWLNDSPESKVSSAESSRHLLCAKKATTTTRTTTEVAITTSTETVTDTLKVTASAAKAAKAEAETTTKAPTTTADTTTAATNAAERDAADADAETTTKASHAQTRDGHPSSSSRSSTMRPAAVQETKNIQIVALSKKFSLPESIVFSPQ